MRVSEVVANRCACFVPSSSPPNVTSRTFVPFLRKCETFFELLKVQCPDAQTLGFPAWWLGAELPMFELYLSTPKPAWAQSSGWSYCSPSVLGTTPPRHMERGRDAIKLSTSWGVCAWAVARSLNVVLTHLCACVRTHFPALLMTESQLKMQMQGSFWKTQRWFLLPSHRRPSFGHQLFNLFRFGGGWNLIYCN